MLERLPLEPPEASEDEAATPGPPDANEDERASIIAALGPTPVAIDEIIRFTGLRPAVVHLVLLELDLAGRIERHPGQRVSLTG